ncbi:MAG: hypothetical protein D6692_04860 [Planctomycetota bacterium]|nr:MAG: hypothetical protein D6692_04860 [Planctomycetota bacterium]
MNRALPLLLTLTAALLPACESGSGAVRPAPGVAIADTPADPEAVALLTAEPSRPFRVVGAVRAFADARIESRVEQARTAAESEARRQGALVDADAVLIDDAFVAQLEGGAIESSPFNQDDRNLQRPGGAAYATRPVFRVILQGRAIRWLPTQPPSQPPTDPAAKPAPNP